jgi:hypothetical protein
MKSQYILYGLLIGLLPFAIGMVAAEAAPHSAAAQLPWLTMVTLPAGLLIGVVAGAFAR